MTPKEKAKELFERFKIYSRNTKYEKFCFEYRRNDLVRNDNAKQCALICVAEILKEIQFAKIDDTDRCLDSDLDYFEHWQQVKQEIEKL